MKSSRNILILIGTLVLIHFPKVLSGAEVVDGDLGLKIDHYLQKAEANGYAGSVLVARGEKVILAKGYGVADRESKVKQTAETVFSIGSLTQQLTRAAVLQPEMMGKL